MKGIDPERLYWIRLFSRGFRSSATWGLRGLPGLSIFYHRPFDDDPYGDPYPGWVVDYMEGERAPWEMDSQDPAFLVARLLLDQRFQSRQEALQAVQIALIELKINNT